MDESSIVRWHLREDFPTKYFLGALCKSPLERSEDPLFGLLSRNGIAALSPPPLWMY